MPPKRVGDKKTTKKPSDHPTYIQMITAAITALKDRSGSSRQAILKYIKGNYKNLTNPEVHLKMALKRGVTSGKLVHSKGIGASGSFKLAQKATTTVKRPAVKSRPKKTATAAAKKPKPKSPARKPAASKAKKSPTKKRSTPLKKKPATKRKTPAKKPAGGKKPAAKRTTSKKGKK
ncbi:histone H1-delta-like [Corticium candelabrum]|uniref:histone H1-delta-like n=1 Tax=Corticium candelabrum TaxID=121492 RepID=UPI002E26B671|nr:histone H1-delta-like [Corticium candelabrum]